MDLLSSGNNTNEDQVPANTSLKFKDDNFIVVFFNIKTEGFNLSNDILQISFKCSKFTFDAFITPTQVINPAATKVNGLSKIQKKLYEHGQEV